MLLRLMLVWSLSAVVWAQDADEFWKTLPPPQTIEKGPRWVLTAPDDPLYKQQRDQGQSGSNSPAFRKLAEELSTQYPGNDAAMRKDPRFQQLLVLGASSGPDVDYRAQIEEYTEKNRAWLKREKFAQVKGWKGAAALLVDGPQTHYRSMVEFQANNGYFQTSLARQCWTGSFRVTFQNEGADPQPRRTIEMADKAHAQLFLGREGWFVKFKEVRSNNFYVPLPTISNVLLNLPWLEKPGLTALLLTGQSNAELDDRVDYSDSPDAYLQGFPLDRSGLRQRGAVVYHRPGGIDVRVGWDFAPN